MDSTIQRRTFLAGSTLIISECSLSATQPLPLKEPSVSVGMLTDLHYADKSPRGSRHYRESLAKIDEASIEFKKNQIQMAVELGDLIDAADSVPTELGYLKTINRKFEAIAPERHYVLGNHCVDTLTKEEFLGEVGQKESYYSFDKNGFHFVILDSCFTSEGVAYRRKNFQWTDANLPEHEMDWLASDLIATKLPTIVFAHQRLDVTTSHGVRNASAIRDILERTDRVKAVFQGHSHQNDLKWINGIPYCTCVAMVEGSGPAQSGYSILDLYPDESIRVRGFRKQKSQPLDKEKPGKNPDPH